MESKSFKEMIWQEVYNDHLMDMCQLVFFHLKKNYYLSNKDFPKFANKFTRFLYQKSNGKLDYYLVKEKIDIKGTREIKENEYGD